jgi:nitroreductase/dihydropteridine reductase
MSSFLSSLEWRRAVKAFVPQPPDATPIDIEAILSAATLAPSSFGLQPYKIIVVTDADAKRRLRTVAFDQPQVSDCTHLLIFCARTNLEDRIEDFVRSTGCSEAQQEMIRGFVSSLSHATSWAKQQAMIALGFALAAAAELRIASCPMEGFNADGVAAILDLPHYMTPTAFLALGYADSGAPPLPPRFRFPRSDLVDHVSSLRTVPATAVPSRRRHVTPVRRRREKTE